MAEVEALREGAEELVGWLEGGVSGSEAVVHLRSPSEIAERMPRGTLSLDSSESNPNEALPTLRASLSSCVNSSHPRFLNQLYAAPDLRGLLADWAISTVNANVHTFEAAPVFTATEREALRKLCSLCAFPPDHCEGIFLPGTSLGNAYALHLARHEHFPNIGRRGMLLGMPEGKAPCAFVGRRSHYSYGKVAALAGVGTANVIPVEERESDGSMDPEDLRAKAKHAQSELDLIPFFVGATSGTTVKGSFDSLRELRDVCDELGGLWLHTDAAWGGPVLLSPRESTRAHMHGIEHIDSVVFALHKLLGMPIQCSPLLVRRNGLLAAANSSGASYLFQPDKLHSDQDMGDLTLGCGRRADGFKLWFAWRLTGTEELRQRVERCEQLAEHLETVLCQRLGKFVPVFERQFSTLCFWFIPPSMRVSEADLERARTEHNVNHVRAKSSSHANGHCTDSLRCENKAEALNGESAGSSEGRPMYQQVWRDWLLESERSKMRLGKVTSTLKKRLQASGDAVVAYQPLGDLPNFFRVAFTGAGHVDESEAEKLLDLMEHHGSDL